MALPSDVTTRIDQLHADLKRVQLHHQARAGVPHSGPMFTSDGDGTVRDRQGNVIHKPAPVKP